MIKWKVLHLMVLFMLIQNSKEKAISDPKNVQFPQAKHPG